MTDVRLYLVSADKADYDDFQHAVVWATDPLDALAVAAEQIKKYDEQAHSAVPGTWDPPAQGATLTAVEVPKARGPVLGHARPC